jgi:hypothetical protein
LSFFLAVAIAQNKNSDSASNFHVAKTVELLKLDLNIDVGRETVGLLFQQHWDLCSRAKRDDKRKLGCRSMIIEIVESLVFKIKI